MVFYFSNPQEIKNPFCNIISKKKDLTAFVQLVFEIPRKKAIWAGLW